MYFCSLYSRKHLASYQPMKTPFFFFFFFIELNEEECIILRTNFKVRFVAINSKDSETPKFYSSKASIYSDLS